MQMMYSQKNDIAQKKDAPTAASVLDTSSQSESLQRKADLANNAAQRAEAPHPNNTGMPDNLKAGIESLSGFSMDDVRVHYNSSKPATVQALAYTQGTDIHVAPGQEKHLPHEAWHVAQQMAGRVSPTTNINGMPVNDDAGLEHEADVMGEKAIQKIDDKSSKNKGICTKVVQCKNSPAYFETKNKEKCDNSRYYVNVNGYVRIAPINAGRSPNQEYHEGERNFVYVHDKSAREFFNRSPMLMKKVEETEYKENIETLITEIGVDPPENLGIFLKMHKGDISNISRVPRLGWSPFDWDGHSTHPGHPIEKLGPYKDPEENEKNLSLYKERNGFASEYAKEKNSFFRKQLEKYLDFLEQQSQKELDGKKISSITNSKEKLKKCLERGTPEKIMDEYFSLVWYKGITEGRSGCTKEFFKRRKPLPENTRSDRGTGNKGGCTIV